MSNVEAITDCSFYSFCFLTNTEKKENYILCNITHFQSLNKKTISDALRIQNLPRVRVQLFRQAYGDFDCACKLHVVNVDVSRPWTIENYDGSEYVRYLDTKDYKKDCPQLNYYIQE